MIRRAEGLIGLCLTFVLLALANHAAISLQARILSIPRFSVYGVQTLTGLEQLLLVLSSVQVALLLAGALIVLCRSIVLLFVEKLG
jgi:hypothetical protein